MRYLSCLIFSWWILSSHAADKDYALELTQKLVKAYYTPYPLTYTFDMHQYDSSGKVFIESMKGEITSCTRYYDMTYGAIEVIIEDSFMLTRNAEIKEILLKPIRVTQRDSLLGLSIPSIIERIKANHIQVKKLYAGSTSSTYELAFDDLAEGVYMMTVSTKTGYIERLEVQYYAGNDRFRITPYTMKIHYSGYRSVPPSSPLKKYFRFQGAQMEMTEKYKDYKVYRF